MHIFARVLSERAGMHAIFFCVCVRRVCCFPSPGRWPMAAAAAAVDCESDGGDGGGCRLKACTVLIAFFSGKMRNAMRGNGDERASERGGGRATELMLGQMLPMTPHRGRIKHSIHGGGDTEGRANESSHARNKNVRQEPLRESRALARRIVCAINCASMQHKERYYTILYYTLE